LTTLVRQETHQFAPIHVGVMGQIRRMASCHL